MPVPEFQSVMRPVLELLADGETQQTTALADLVGDRMGLSEADRAETMPAGRQTVLHNRVAWVVAQLAEAGLVTRPERGSARLTPAGSEALDSLPERIELSDLDAFLSYAQIRRRQKKGRAEAEGSVPDGAGEWGEFVEWAVRVEPELSRLDDEHGRKRALATELAAARALYLAGEADWRTALGDLLSTTHLMNWRPVAQIRERLERGDDAIDVAVDVLWGPEGEVPLAALDEFSEKVHVAGLSLSPGDAVAFASILLMARDAESHPPYLPTPVRSWCSLVGETARRDTSSGRYGQLLALCDELLRRGGSAGLGVSTRLEAQGLVWALLKQPVVELGLDEADRVAFALWRDGKVPDGAPRGEGDEGEDGESPSSAGRVPPLPAVSEQLAAELHMHRDELQEIVSVWAKRQQVVFFGPPGTGKTYLARALADHVTGGGDGWELVQFHPSYAYEDFMEGYRPSHGPDGQAHFTLKPGPLRRIAERASRPENADQPFVLIIDEMNRANLAKVFGELYFLLEYRNESMSLQYSDTQFSLPKNLFIIGTMNTADRSIAMIDAAIRRRFAFIELHPAEAPVAGLLERALPEGDTRGQLLDALNELIGTDDRDLQVGPSYLMRPEAESEAGLQRIWRFDILPLLEEHYVGRRTRAEVHEQFGLEAVRRQAGLVEGEAPVSAASTGGIDVEAVAAAEGVDPAVLRALLGIMDARESAAP